MDQRANLDSGLCQCGYCVHSGGFANQYHGEFDDHGKHHEEEPDIVQVAQNGGNSGECERDLQRQDRDAYSSKSSCDSDYYAVLTNYVRTKCLSPTAQFRHLSSTAQ